jgi:glycosyltransferase involved in cell wall biosynthesis
MGCARIAVCIATFNRCASLDMLLEQLSRLQFVKNPPPAVGVVVVDNDAGESARGVVESRAGQCSFSLRYAVEPRRGVSYARNRSIRLAEADVDFIAFIDDDELPHLRWLDELMAAQRRWNADIIAGPVLPIYAPDVPEWVIEGGFFMPRPKPDGAVLELCHTNNTLIRAEILRSMLEPFDPRHAANGNEDINLFGRLSLEGRSIRWADRAIVWERITANRANVNWIMKRGFWEWSSYSRLEKELHGSIRRTAIRGLKGLGLVVCGIALSVASPRMGKDHLARSWQRIFQGLGSMAGLLGIKPFWPR